MSTMRQMFLLVTDLTATRTFYEDALGLEPRDVGDSSVAYETGPCELKVQTDFDRQVLERFNMTPPPAEGRGAGAVHVIETDVSLNERYERVEGVLADAAGALLTEPREVPWGDRMFLVADPDGYVFEVRSRDS